MAGSDGGERFEIELNPSEQPLYDRLRARFASPQAQGDSTLRDVVFLVPDLAVLLARLVRDPRVPLGAKVVALLGVGYVLSPVDLIPEILGPVGFVDDLLILSAALSRIVNYVHPDLVRAHWSGSGDALEAIQRLTAWSEHQVVGRLRSLVRGAGRLLLRGSWPGFRS